MKRQQVQDAKNRNVISKSGKELLSMYVLTDAGKKECEIYIAELKAKRKEILDAGLDTADETFVDYTPEELFEDLLDFGIDEDGEIYNGYGVTDHYDADRAFGLKLGEDFIEVDEGER